MHLPPAAFRAVAGSRLWTLALGAAPLFALVPSAIAGPAVRILESDDRHVVIEVRPGEPVVESVRTEQHEYVRVRYPGLALTDETGAPELPVGGISLAVPPGARPVLSVRTQEWSGLRAGAIVPVPERIGVRGEPFGPSQVVEREPREEALYRSATSLPERPFRLSPVRGVRTQRVVNVVYHAALSEPFARGHRLLERAVLEVRFERDRAERALEAGRPVRPGELWERTTRSAVANAEQASSWARGGPGDAGTVGDTPWGGGSQWKVRVDATGIREIPFSALAAQGFPGNVPLPQVTVYQRRFRIDAVDSGAVAAADLFVEIPVPVMVQDRNSNGGFDSGDGLVFWARSFRDQWMTSGWEHEDTFDTSNYVWIRVDVAGGGARMPLVRPGGSLSGAAADSLVSTPAPVFRENDRRYTQYPMDFGPGRGGFESEFYYWNDHRLLIDPGVGWQTDDPFTVTDLAPGVPATLRVRVAGTGKPNFHAYTNVTRFTINNVDVATRQFYSPQHYNGGQDGAAVAESTVTSYAVPVGQLVEGANTFRFWGQSYLGNGTASPFNQARFLFDWYEVTYPRQLLARSDQLQLDTSQGTAGNVLARVRDFGGTDVLLFDLTDPASPARVGVDAPSQVLAAGGGRFDLRFDHDNGANGPAAFLAVRSSAVPALASTDVTRVDPPTLLGGGQGARYVVATHDDFVTGAAELAAWRSERYSSIVAPLSQVWDVFRNGMIHPEALKAYAAYGLHRWSDPVEFLCLVGDASEDHRGVGSQSMPDLLPSHSIWASYEGAPEESDQYFAELTRDDTGAWDDLSDIYVGRLALNDPAELDWNLQRMRAYESGETEGIWRRRVLLMADDALSGSLGGGFGAGYGWKGPSELEFCNVNRFIADSLLAIHPVDGLIPDVLCVSDWTHPCGTNCDSLPPPACGIWCECWTPDDPNDWVDEYTCTRVATIEAVLPVLRDKLDAGVLIWNYQGHANKFFLAHEEVYRDDTIVRRDVETLRNEGKPFVFLGFACHLAEFDRADEATREDCLSEKMMNVRQAAVEVPAGAVASFASSGYEFLHPNLPFNVHVMNAFFYPEIATDPANLDGGGAGLPGGAAAGYVWTLGESTTRARLMYQNDYPAPIGGGTTNNRQAAQRYVLLGDPALQPNVAPPAMQATVSGQSVESVDDTFFVSVDDYPQGLSVSVTASDGRGITLMRVVDSVEGPVDPDSYVVNTLDETADGVARVQQLDYSFVLRPGEIYETAFEVTDTTGRPRAFTLRADTTFEFVGGEPGVFPNPFPDRMNLLFKVTNGVNSGLLEVFTITGRKVRSIPVGSLPANSQHTVTWDGRDANGLSVANGTYLTKLSLDGETGTLVRTMPVTKLR